MTKKTQDLQDANLPHVRLTYGGVMKGMISERMPTSAKYFVYVFSIRYGFHYPPSIQYVQFATDWALVYNGVSQCVTIIAFTSNDFVGNFLLSRLGILSLNGTQK